VMGVGPGPSRLQEGTLIVPRIEEGSSVVGR
jgi:hypothetical protein